VESWVQRTDRWSEGQGQSERGLERDRVREGVERRLHRDRVREGVERRLEQRKRSKNHHNRW